MQRRDLVESFDMDEESLSQLSPQEAFALGVEWAIFFKKLKNGSPIRDVCLSNNSRRLEKLAQQMGRTSVCRSTSAPNWKQILIGKAQKMAA